MRFVNNEILRDTDVSPEKFWSDFDQIVHELAPINKKLWIKDKIYKKIDDWHIENKGKEFDIHKYKKFLNEIGYLKDQGPDFKLRLKILMMKYLQLLDHN